MEFLRMYTMYLEPVLLAVYFFVGYCVTLSILRFCAHYERMQLRTTYDEVA